MRSLGRFTCPLILGFLLPYSPTSDRVTPSFARNLPAVAAGEPIFAFNGRDLTGFYSFTRYSKFIDRRQVFTVRDGMIRVSGEEPGGLATLASFANYHLVAEWRWGNQTWPPRRFEARNSGIMVHSVGPDGDALACWMQSIECQLNEGGCGDLIVVPGKSGLPLSLSSEVRIGADGQTYYEKNGTLKNLKKGRFNWWGRDPDWKNVLWFRGPNEVENPAGSWNRMEIVCDGDAITCVLNGVVVNAATRCSQTSGKILLQSEGAEIYFRKFEIRPLMKPTNHDSTISHSTKSPIRIKQI